MSATLQQAGPVPFATAAEAWFWTMGALARRRDGQRLRLPPGPERPCEPDDVIRCLDGLYRRRRIDLMHARALRVWGERGREPNANTWAEQSDARLWREAIGRLDWILRTKGIVA